MAKDNDMRSLISVWEVMDSGGGGVEEEGLLLLPPRSGSSRRMSQELAYLRGKFEMLGEGETSKPGCVLTKPTEQKLVPVTFSTLGMETKKQTARAGRFRKNLLSSANVLRGDTLLAMSSANRKRG